MVVEPTGERTLTLFVRERTNPATICFAVGEPLSNRLNRLHEVIMRNIKEFVNGMIRANGMELHRATFKPAYIGVNLHVSPKRLDRYSNEFSGTPNARQLNTEVQMTESVQVGIGNRLPFHEPIGSKPSRQILILDSWNAWQ